MKHLKEKWKPLALVVLAMVATYGQTYIDTFGDAYGLFSPTDSNQDLITFNDDQPPQSQHVETTTQALTLVDWVRFLGRDDVTLEGSTIANHFNNDSVKYFLSKDEHVQRSDKNAGAFDQTGTNRTWDQISEKSPNINCAKNCQCDPRTLANTPAQFSRSDIPEKLTQAGDLPQTLAISSTATISSTCSLEEWCELQVPLKFKFSKGVTFLENPELKQKGLDSKQNALQSTLEPKFAADLRAHRATLNYLHESYAEPNQASEIPNTASGKTADTEVLQKMSPFLEEDKIINVKFHADYIHLDDPKWKKTAAIKQCELFRNESLHVNFEGRESLPECANVLEQSDCDSCWAHGTTEALNDRACIEFEGALQTSLSVADTTACCNSSDCFSSSCKGGKVISRCDWLKKTSVVSCGPFGQEEFCYDYTMPLYARHVEPATPLLCDKVAPFCCNFCPSNTTTVQASDKVKGMSSYGVGPTVDAIKKELLTYYCVNSAFTVYGDLLSYTSGVQQLLENSWCNLWDDQGTSKIFMDDCRINDLKHAGSIVTHLTATKNAQNNDPKVISDSKNLKTSEQPEDDVEIAPTSDSPAQAQTQACEDTTKPESKTNACIAVDQMCFNSQLVAAYLADLDKFSIFKRDCLQNTVASSRKTCQSDSACTQALQAVVPKNSEKSWDSATEPDARRTNYNHCKCYKAAVEDALTKLNESRPFTHEVGPHVTSLDNDLLRNKCGIHDWNQLCGKIVFKNSPEDGLIQFFWEEHKSTHFKGRKLQPQTLVNSGQCTGPTTNYNLLNINVLASQSYGIPSVYNNNANQGCDGVLQWYNPFPSNSKEIFVVANPVAPNVYYWAATFQQTTNVRSILYLYRDVAQNVRFRVGDNPNYLDNPLCIGGYLTAGGWLDCSLSGKYLALTSTIGAFTLMDVMCYSQYFVHHNALSSTLSSTLTTAATYLCTTSTNCRASNVIQTTLVIWNDFPNPPNPCCIYSQPQTDPELKVNIPADLMIECVIITPSDQSLSGGSNTDITNWQKNIEISILNSAGQKEICGTLSDYNLYTEVNCKKVGNQIIVKKPGSNKTLAMAGVSILSNCECSQSSLNPGLISRASSPLASPSTISTTSTGAPVSIKLNKQMYDTVSSVCGNADGFTKCGLRTLVFTDKMTGFEISFPYKGFELNSDQSELTLSPAKATRTSVLTVTVKLDKYPTVTFSQDITTIVEQPAPVAIQPLKIPNLAVNAMISQEAFLVLPQLDAQYTYVVVSKQNFEASVDQNQLKVLSKNEIDVGTYNLDLVASSSSDKVSFEVKVILTLPRLSETKTTSSPVQGQTDLNTTQVSSQAGDYMQSDPVLGQLQKFSCNDEGECVDPTNSRFSCYYDEETGKMVCGVDLVKKINTSSQPKTLNPIMQVSRIDSKGFFTLIFSEPMNFTSLINEANSTSEIVGSKNRRAHSRNQIDQKRYLLSAEHINITIQCNSDQDSSKLQFKWVVINITETQIKIQILFKNPISISSDLSFPDILVIKLLPGFLEVKSKASNLIIMNPLRTVKKIIPNQLALGETTETVEEVAEIVTAVGEAVVIGTFIISVFLSGVLGSMFLMVNSFQMLMIYSYLTVPMPANVTMVMVEINTIASFDYLPTDTIFQKLFKFSTTVTPFVSFEAMGVETLRLTLYLGTIFFILAQLFVLSLLFLISWPFKNKFSFLGRFHSMMRDKYYWSGIIRILLESYSDMSVGIMLSWRDPRSLTQSDTFDLVLTCFVTLIVMGGPITQYFLLRKYANELYGDRFQSTYGSLTEGYITTGVLGCQATRYMISWFLLRRFLTAVSVVYLGDQSPIWQIGTIMYLSLADLLMNFHLNAFESKTRSIMAKINDTFVFLISYFPFVYSGLVHNPEQRYDIGWFQNSLCGSMFVTNVAVVIHSYILSVMKECRRKQVEQFNLRVLQKYGFNTKIMVQSVCQRLLTLIQIEWVFFDGTPPRINEQIAPYVEMYRFKKDFSCVFSFEHRAQLVLEIEQIGIQQAEIVADQADQFEIISHEQAEDLVDQYDEFSFYEEQKKFSVQTSVIAEKRIPFSQEQSNREAQADQIIEENAPTAPANNKKKLQRQPEESKSTPTQLYNNDWEKKHYTKSDQATVANKDASTQKNASNNKVMPNQKDTQGPALLQRRRKLIVEEAKDQKAELTQLKNQIFDTVMASLQASGDPMVSSDSINSIVRLDLHLLPDEIQHMSEQDQKTEVKHLVSVCPEYINLQKKLGKHQEKIVYLTEMEDLLKDVVKNKIAGLDGLKKLVKFHKDKAARAPNHKLEIAKKEILDAIKRLNDRQRDIKEDQEELKRLAADKTYHQGEIIFFSQF